MEFIKLTDSVIRPANSNAYTALDIISDVTADDHFVFGVAASGKTANTLNCIPTIGDVGGSGAVRSTKFRLDWVNIHLNEVATTALDGALYLLEVDFTDVADADVLVFAGADAEDDLITVIDIPIAGWQLIGTTESFIHIEVNEVFELSEISSDVTGQLFGALQAVNAHDPAGNSKTYKITLGITKLLG